MTIKENLEFLTQALKDNSNPDLLDIEDIQELVAHISEEETRKLSKLFIQFCHSLTEHLIKTQRSVIGINILSAAITKFREDRSQLTPIHSDYLLLCLDAKCLNQALKFLEIDYIDIYRTSEKDEDVNHVLLFYYYGGLIYAAIKNFDRASFFLEVVLTIPATVMSPIMQEAYKKQIILTLLLNGKLPENMLPKYTSPCVIKYKKQVGHPYLKLAHDYSSSNYEKINSFIQNNTSVYERDENMGLIKQCLTQVHKRSIQRLTKTFLTLPLRDVANHVGLANEKEAELYILNMIDDGEIFATINQRDGMVVFQDNPEKFDSAVVFQKLQEDMSTSASLIEKLRKLESDSGGLLFASDGR